MTIPLASVAPRLYVSGKSHVAVPACAAVTVAPTTGTPAPVRTANRILAIAGVITGRAIYQGTLDFKQALVVAEKFSKPAQP